MRLAFIALAATACGRIDFGDLADAGPDPTRDALAVTPTFVQATTTSNAAGPSTTVMLPSPIAAGDSLVVAAWSWGPQTASAPAGSVTDTANSGLTLAGTVQSVPGDCGGMNVGGAIFFAHASSVIANDTVTFTSNNTENGMVAIEYTSLLAPDQTSSAITLAAPSPQTFATAPLVTTAAPELLVSLGIPCAGAGGSVTWVSTDNFDVRGFSTDTAGQPAMVADELAVAAGSFDASWTITFLANPAVAASLLVAFR